MTGIHRTDTTLTRDGELILDHLPFRAGQSVEVIVVPIQASLPLTSQKLHGSVLRFDHPTEPVDEANWDVLR